MYTLVLVMKMDPVYTHVYQVFEYELLLEHLGRNNCALGGHEILKCVLDCHCLRAFDITIYPRLQLGNTAIYELLSLQPLRS